MNFGHFRKSHIRVAIVECHTDHLLISTEGPHPDWNGSTRLTCQKDVGINPFGDKTYGLSTLTSVAVVFKTVRVTRRTTGCSCSIAGAGVAFSYSLQLRMIKWRRRSRFRCWCDCDSGTVRVLGFHFNEFPFEFIATEFLCSRWWWCGGWCSGWWKGRRSVRFINYTIRRCWSGVAKVS